MIRLFVALTLPEDVRQYLLRLQTGIRGANWQTDEQLHITLNFIGDIDEGTARDIDAALDSIRMPAFNLRLDGAGLFGTMAKPRILWANIAPREPVIHLHDKIESALRRLGIGSEERKFSPHVTLARMRDTQAAATGVMKFLEAHGGLMTTDFAVRKFALYSSRLTDRGSVYRIEASYDLDSDYDLDAPY